MNRSVLFDSPFLLGFEHTRSLIERAAKAAAESYPPYNVEDRGEGAIRISLAVAGFSPDQLEVSVEDRQLDLEPEPANPTSLGIDRREAVGGGEMDFRFLERIGFAGGSERMDGHRSPFQK